VKAGPPDDILKWWIGKEVLAALKRR